MDGMKAKAIRYYMGESMESFGKRIGVAASTISAIENLQRDVSDYVRSKLIRLEAGLPDDFYAFYERFKTET
ncbi:helix-turn-helix transcriptional regulator [Bacillus sp. EB106-08-02-XG196]|jgi:transcriptional regulator with XRE-family HTH domain|uniref:helix-turn-helix transcriptional regulator n=1 Tax=Bacillus sp. EB106-08-02-XG196 TaxID=2737049 RepID=UPI0015C46935|nr:helix-turn-helix transcriptional regulator [Bacillus sp. EB106-08-02-XG196]NWQ40383.1 helix-turn-helix transcriptional regulator [Bacillus sp. EB106-08-02-XG196]